MEYCYKYYYIETPFSQSLYNIYFLKKCKEMFLQKNDDKNKKEWYKQVKYRVINISSVENKK